MEAMGIWRGSINFHPRKFRVAIKIHLVLCMGWGALKTYFNSRSGLEKYFKGINFGAT